MGLTHQQFIDLCILLGCDYCDTIKGIGPKRAIDLIKQHDSIEEILENIDPNVHLFTLFKGIYLLLNVTLQDMTYSESEDRICNGCKKIMKSRQGSTQGRLDTFFTVTGSISFKRKVIGFVSICLHE
ncbi:flap endonuclease 1 [Labeo rohita]|uniref:Flap endonuclease 1 n=1 Tax=Labeo rohita TaxID=84645 RepID=A0A498NEB0_LABRO|nr:flap endonuclease 1 [Labeo rohita]